MCSSDLRRPGHYITLKFHSTGHISFYLIEILKSQIHSTNLGFPKLKFMDNRGKMPMLLDDTSSSDSSSVSSYEELHRGSSSDDEFANEDDDMFGCSGDVEERNGYNPKIVSQCDK